MLFDAYSDFSIQLKLTVTNACGTVVKFINESHVIPPGPPNCAYLRTANTVVNNALYKVYPNPSHDIVYIELKDPNQQPNQSATIIAELYNMMGELKQNVLINNNTANINVSNIPTGIYVLKINIDGITESHQISVE